MKKNIFSILRFVVSFALVYFLLSKINFSELFSQLSSINYFFLLLAFICQLLVIFVGSYRWQTLLSSRDINVKFKKLLSITFIAQFFNSFLPGSTGGDFVRIYKVVGHTEDKVYAGISVLAERIIGFYSIFIFVLIAGFFSLGLLPVKFLLTIFAIVVFAFIGLFSFVVFKPWIIRFLETSKAKDSEENIFAKIKQYAIVFYEALHFFITHRKILFKIVVLSLLMQFLSIISCYYIARSIGLSVNVFYFFIFVPIMFFATAIPISMSGIGIREGVFVYLFKQINVPSGQAILVSLLFFSLGMFFSLIGGVVHLWSNIKTSD